MVSSWIATVRTSRLRVQSLGATLRRSFPTKAMQADLEGLLERGTALAVAGAWECDLNTNVLTWTDGVFDIFGLPRGIKVSREDTLELYGEDSRAEMEHLRAEAIERQQSFTLDAKVLRPNGDRRWMRLTAGIMCRNGRPTHLYGLKQDVTQEREVLESLRQVAEHDALTGLASRSLFQSRFLNSSVAARMTFPLGALVLFDIDGFKQINDKNGHAAGDACLEAVATRLTGCFRDAAMIARIGGDEFAVLLRDPVGERLGRRVAASLFRLTQPIHWNGQSLRVTASAGVAAAHDEWTYDPDIMFSTADAALYAAKRAGRNRVHLDAA